jgi:hypothetical protein
MVQPETIVTRNREREGPHLMISLATAVMIGSLQFPETVHIYLVVLICIGFSLSRECKIGCDELLVVLHLRFALSHIEANPDMSQSFTMLAMKTIGTWCGERPHPEMSGAKCSPLGPNVCRIHWSS